MTEQPTTRTRLFSTLLAATMFMAACGGSDDAGRVTPGIEAIGAEIGSGSDAPSATSEGSVTLLHDVGDVEVEAPAERIVTTSDETTKLVVALGLEPIGIASTRVDATVAESERFDDYFLSTDQLGRPEFVDTETLNFETIAALVPDLIVHGAADDNVDTLADIAPTAVYDVQVPGRWQDALVELGEATGRERRAEQIIDDYDAELADLRERLGDVSVEHPALTVIYPNYRGGADNFVFDADFALASVVPELGFDLVGIDAAEPPFPGVGTISTERYGDLAAVTDTIIALDPTDWSETASGPFLESLSVPVLGVQVVEGRPSAVPLSTPFYLDAFVAALDEQSGAQPAVAADGG